MLNTDKNEIIEMLVINADDCTVISNCKPESVKFVIDSCINYLNNII